MNNTNLNILIYADVDMNLIDGSSIWLNSLIQVLAREPGNKIDVLLKARITKDLLLEDLYNLENVTLTDPYKKFPGFNFQNKNRLVVDDALNLVGSIFDENRYNCLILRGFDICKKAFISINNKDKIVPYITNFTDDPELISKEEKQILQQMYADARLMFLQTEEMKLSFRNIIGAVEDKIAILPPMVPDFPEKEPDFRNHHHAMVYVGKFSNDYYLYESLLAFSDLNDPGYRFNIAGDKFHLDLKVPKEDLVHMMETIPGVNWKKALNREEVSRFIEDADLGLCWRSETIDNERSMELSTKLLEYGRLGKPVLVRRIPIHERLLGTDYPFYVDTAAELVQKINLAFTNAELYEKAARKVYEVSLGHSFSHVSRQIMPYLDKFRTETRTEPDEKEPEIPAWKSFFKDLSRKISK